MASFLLHQTMKKSEAFQLKTADCEPMILYSRQSTRPSSTREYVLAVGGKEVRPRNKERLITRCFAPLPLRSPVSPSRFRQNEIFFFRTSATPSFERIEVKIVFAENVQKGGRKSGKGVPLFYGNGPQSAANRLDSFSTKDRNGGWSKDKGTAENSRP